MEKSTLTMRWIISDYPLASRNATAMTVMAATKHERFKTTFLTQKAV